ncbi:hypothetical protein FDUTEX481_02247 [Tolypothrix sp. PCC 7601]|nr:hypothetical protein FDUTEX481_02247 [Tolypothrix sp. PCC 7601]
MSDFLRKKGKGEGVRVISLFPLTFSPPDIVLFICHHLLNQ